MIKSICPKCGEQYYLGYNGVAEGCDECFGIKRDNQGFAWYPDEGDHVYAPNEGSPEYTVTRQEAFGQ